MRNKLTPLALLLVATQLTAQTAIWEQTSFPNNNYVYFISIVGNRIFAGSQTGLFMSEDEGTSWTNMTANYNVASANDLIYQDSVYYLSSWVSGVYKSSDLLVWDFIGDSLPKMVTSIEFFNGDLYAGSSKSVYVFNKAKGFWEADSLKIKINHNKYILALKAHNGALYAAGCNYLYKKESGQWAALDTNYQYCGNKILEIGPQIFLNTTGSGIYKFNSLNAGITESIFINSQDSLSLSPADVAFFENEMYVLSRNSIYYHNLDTSEVVCDDVLSSIAFGYGNVFVGTNTKGIWKRGWSAIPRDSDLGINDIKGSIFLDVYPTPSAGKLLTTYKIQKEHSARFTLFDATGRVILTKEITESGSDEIYLSAPGVYLAVLTNGDKKMVKKVIVQ